MSTEISSCKISNVLTDLPFFSWTYKDYVEEYWQYKILIFSLEGIYFNNEFIHKVYFYE